MVELRQAKRCTAASDTLLSSFYRVLLYVLGALVAVGSASACQICVPLPTQTLADRLLESDAVVRAREDPQRPYHYAAVDILKGNPRSVAIDMFINTRVRRYLTANPASAMLLARNSKDGEWRTLGLTHGDFERVVRRILSFEGLWIPKETDNLKRLREMAPLLGNQDTRLHELAFLEIGRASYGSIKLISANVSLERVRAMLSDPRYIEWRGLDILLLGLSNAQQDRARVIHEIEDRRRRSNALNLDAWATAYVEVGGVAGIDQLADWYFRDASRSRDELRNIVRALSVHAANDAGLRESVVAAYKDLLDYHPLAGPDIARDLIAWQQWDLSEQMRILQPQVAESDPLGAYAIKLYLQRVASRNHPMKK